MSPRHASSNSGNRRYEDASAKAERGAPARPPMELPKPLKVSVAGASQRVLPLPTQTPASQMGATQYQTHPTTPQLPPPRRSLNTVQSGPAASSSTSLLPGIPYQYRPVMPPTTQGATRPLQDSFTAYPRENVASTSQRPVNGYPSIYNSPPQSMHREDRLQPQGVATGYISRETQRNESSTPQASLATAATAGRSSTSQIRQPMGPGQPQISSQDM